MDRDYRAGRADRPLRYHAAMTRRSEQLSEELQDYTVAHSAAPDAVLSQLAAETAAAFPDAAVMQIGPEQGTFMTLLTQLTGASRALEIGTFTGYSSICLARGLADGGKLTCCDISNEWTSVARRYWELAGVADRIDLQLRPAVETLRAMPATESFDIAFIDADKAGYVSYWDEVVPRIRPGGAILVDNTLFHGGVVDPDSVDVNVAGIRAFNDHAVADDRVVLVLLPIGDGLTLARKK
jgi:caffeoyl-CoA O-methyltransferase